MPIWLANLVHILLWPTRQWWWRLIIVGWVIMALALLAQWLEGYA